MLVVIGGEGQRLELIEIIGGLLTYTFWWYQWVGQSCFLLDELIAAFASFFLHIYQVICCLTAVSFFRLVVKTVDYEDEEDAERWGEGRWGRWIWCWRWWWGRPDIIIIIMLQQGLWFLSGRAPEKKLFGEGAEEGCIFKKIAKHPKVSPSLPGCSLCRRVFRREPPMWACLRPWFPHLLVHAALQEVVVLNSRGRGDEDNDDDDDDDEEEEEEEDDNDDDLRVGEWPRWRSYMPLCKRLWCSTPKGEVMKMMMRKRRRGVMATMRIGGGERVQ